MIESKTSRLAESRNPGGYGFKRISDEIIEQIKTAKKDGKPLKQIAMELNVSIPTICKYAAGIKPVVREKTKDVLKRSESHFDHTLLKNIPLENGRLKEIVGEFIRLQRAYQTKRNYFLDLSKFFNWIEADGKAVKAMDDISFEVGMSYKEYLEKEGYKPSVVRRYLTTVKTFLNYGMKRGYITHNPVSVIKMPPISRHVVETESIDQEDLQKILSTAMYEAANRTTDDRRMISHRNFVGIYILTAVGCRAGALLSLRVKDIKKRSGSTFLSLEAKGEDIYTVSIDKKAAAVLEKYVSTYFRDVTEDAYIMFKNAQNFYAPMSNGALNMMLKKLCHKSGVPRNKRIVPHSFRTTYASNQYKSGKSLKEIQTRLNHKNINQTAAYLKFADTETEAAWIPDLGDEMAAFMTVGGEK